eukprot:jgi/Tetstr1/449448/TSEL_036543.t1
MEIKEGFRNGSNQQPQNLLKSGKMMLSRTGQVTTRSTLIAHHRDMHGPAHRAQPHLPKAKACAVKPPSPMLNASPPASIVASRPALLCMKYFFSYGPHFTASQLSMLS